LGKTHFRRRATKASHKLARNTTSSVFPALIPIRVFTRLSGFTQRYYVASNLTHFLSIGSEFAIIYFTMALLTIGQIDHLSRDELVVSVKMLSILTKRGQTRIAILEAELNWILPREGESTWRSSHRRL
jgi:hypothetical protein